MKKKSLITYFIILQFFFCGLLVVALNPTIASPSSYNDYDLKSSAVDFSNATVVSDGFDNNYWNDGGSSYTAIAVDSSDKVHIVWQDTTNGVWGIDTEIMHATYTESSGWSNATVISDGYDGTYWNNGGSWDPAIAVDSSDKVHVVWEDTTNGVWGIDVEIMYATYTDSTGWSFVKIISDGYDGIYSFDGSSDNPVIAVDSSDKVHVVWQDYTDGVWGTDSEIMYAYFTSDLGWSLPRVISDGPNDIFWNDDSSIDPAIAVDSSDKVHVVWEDATNGVWGTDTEIMYTHFAIPIPPVLSSPGGIPFGNFYLLFVAVSIIGLVAYKKRKI